MIEETREVLQGLGIAVSNPIKAKSVSKKPGKSEEAKKEDFAIVPEKEKVPQTTSALASEYRVEGESRSEALTNRILGIMRHKLKKLARLIGFPLDSEFIRECMQETFLALLQENLPEDAEQFKRLVRIKTGQTYRHMAKIQKLQSGNGRKFVKGGRGAKSLLDRGQIVPMLLEPDEIDRGIIERVDEGGKEVCYNITPNQFPIEAILSATDFENVGFRKIATGQYIDEQKVYDLLATAKRIKRKHGHADVREVLREYGFKSIEEAQKFLILHD